MRRAVTAVLARAGAAVRVPTSAFAPHRGMAVLAAVSSVKSLDSLAASQPHSDAIKMVTDGAGPIKMSYSQLLKQVDAFANGLFDVPFKTPATMVIWAKDCAETLVAQLGAVKAGVKVIYLDSTAKEQDLVKALDSGARWLLISPTLLPQLEVLNAVNKLFPECEGPAKHDLVIRNAQFPALRFIFTTGFERQTGMVKFAHMLSYGQEPTAVSTLKPALGSIAYVGAGKAPEITLPHLDPSVKLSDVKLVEEH